MDNLIDIADKGMDKIDSIVFSPARKAIVDEIKSLPDACSDVVTGNVGLNDFERSIIEGGSNVAYSIKEKISDAIDGFSEKFYGQIESEPIDEEGNLKPNIEYTTGEFDNHNYETDSQGRITRCSVDELKLTDREERLPHDGDTPDKEKTDDAGHLIADRFGGSPEIDNLVSMDSGVNRSEYKRIENEWAEALEAGKKVENVNINIEYNGDSDRPSEFEISYEIDGEAMGPTCIENERQE